jgi:hypothetical protein
MQNCQTATQPRTKTKMTATTRHQMIVKILISTMEEFKILKTTKSLKTIKLLSLTIISTVQDVTTLLCKTT